jgi:hypothetical protein
VNNGLLAAWCIFTLSLVLMPGASATVDDGLVAHYRMDYGAGDTAYDVEGGQ